jgi:hypothetical protein
VKLGDLHKDELPSGEDIGAEYARLREEFGDLFDTVSEILFRNDPIGINFETNTDEYELEVSTILPRLQEATSPDSLRLIIHQEFVKWFHPDIADPESKYEEIAQEVWAAWRRWRSS